eukprot:TRINITY_DN71599_c0_g1_i1.p1 TRINITY_DN71599_c0_g1~~TRINITY_DN71599_c0_g1_i1.p1  ORF type:complete len:260 (+),score=34.79 TRINITY_DN71599_c0_g1_i1:32-781(+)
MARANNNGEPLFEVPATSELLVSSATDDATDLPRRKASWRLRRVTLLAFSLACGGALCTMLWRGGLNSVFGVIDVATPAYDLLKRENGFEIRRYHASTAVETPMTGKGNEGKSFMRLAGFIGVIGAPSNSRKEKIAMTAPVVTTQEAKGSSQVMMQFILPAGVNSSAPLPTERGVHLITRPAAVFGVRAFSGTWSFSDAEAQAKELATELEASGYSLKTDAPWQFFRYNPPWTLPMFRTNEVAVELQHA